MSLTSRPFCLSAASTLLACLFFLAAAGCHNHAAEEASASNPRGTRQLVSTVDVASIERSDAYRRAVVSYARKDYRDALARVDSLLAARNLSPSARSFLDRQRSLCQTALAGGKPLPPTVPVSPHVNALARPVRTAADADCGPRALLLVCQEMKIATSLPALRTAAGTTADGTTMAGLAKAAKSVGLKAEGVQMDRNALSSLTKPAIAWSSGNHYVAVLSVHHSLMDPSVNGDTANESGGFIATVHDPNEPGEEEMPLGGPTGLLARSGGMLLVLSQSKRLAASQSARSAQ